MGVPLMIGKQVAALPTPPSDLLQRLNTAYELLEAASTPEDVAGLATQASAIHAALKAANLSLEAQNHAARLHLEAERKLGTILKHRDDYHTLPEGVSKDRSHRSQKLASIPQDVWGDWITSTLLTGRELTRASAYKLAPQTKRETGATHIPQAVPPIDQALARLWGLDASDQRLTLLTSTIKQALATLEAKNPRHSHVWRRYHGINDDGTLGAEWTFDAIASQHNWSRPYVESLYYRASHHIRGHIALTTLNQLAKYMAAS